MATTRVHHPWHRITAALVAMAVLVTVFAQIGAGSDAGASPPPPTGSNGPWRYERVSLGAGSAEADGDSEQPAFSADGGSLAFATSATNLTTPASTGPSVVVRSLTAGTNERVSVGTDGSPYTAPRNAAVSGDGNRVVMAYTSNGERALALRDRAAGTTVGIGPGIGLTDPNISDAGDRVVFVQNDTNPFDDDRRPRIWLHDDRPLAPNEGREIDLSNLPGLQDEASRPVISADGNTVAYAAKIGNARGIRVLDVSTRPVGPIAWHPDAFQPALSADGRYLVSVRIDSATSKPILHRLDRLTGEEKVVTGLPVGADQLRVSADGYVVAYYLSYRDEAGDIRHEVRVSRFSSGASESVADLDDDPTIDLSADGSAVAIATSEGLVAGDGNGSSDIYVARHTEFHGPTWPLGSSLVADEVTSNHLTLRWSPAEDDTGISGYVLSQDGRQIANLPASATTAPVNGLDPETEYSFTLVAVDLDGNPSPLLARTVFTDAAPTVPGNLPLGLAMTGGRADLEWEAPNIPFEGYRILRASGADPLVPIATIDSANPFFHDTGLEAETTYRYAVEIIQDGAPVRYTVEQSSTTAPVQLDVVSWTGAGQIGGSVAVTLKGGDGWDADAEVAYRTWLAPDGSPLTTPRTATATVPATIDWAHPGQFVATFPIAEGTAEIVSATGQMSDGASHTVRLTAPRGPLAVAGALDVQLDAPEGSLAGSRVVVANVGQVPARNGTISFPVVPAGSRNVKVVGPTGRVLADQSVTVDGGRTAHASITPAIPATVEVAVTDASGQPVANAPVSITQPTTGVYLANTTTDANGVARPIVGVVAGERVAIKATPPSALAASAANQQFDLVAGANRFDLTLPALPPGAVSGTVTDTDGTPMKGAAVIVDQSADGRSWSYSATTDANGHYSLTALAGFARVRASMAVDQQATATTQLGASPQVVDLVLPKRTRYQVRVNLFTKTVDDGNWQGPLDLDWAAAVHYRLTAQSPTAKLKPTDEVFAVAADPGEQITVCADGAEAGLSSSCKTIVLTDDLDVTTELRLEGVASVQGRLITNGPRPAGLQPVVNVTRRQAEGSYKWIFNYPVKEDRFDVNVAEAGQYRVTVEGWGRPRVFDVDLRAGQRFDVGDLEPLYTPWADRSSLTASKRVVTLGSTTEVRASMHPGGVANVTHAQGRFTIPAGTELVPDSVTLDGQPVPYLAHPDELVVNLPDRAFPHRESTNAYVVRYQLRFVAVTDNTELPITARAVYNGDSQGSVLATLLVKAAGTTIDAVPTSASRRVALSGTAPPGATVEIVDGRFPIGSAVAGPGGFWNLNAELVDLGNASTHELVASVQQDGRLLTSEPRFVKVDERLPELQKVTINRTGSIVSFDPREGVARFPMVHRNEEYTLTGQFGPRGVVDGATARIGGSAVRARDLGDRTWQAKLNPSILQLGGLGFDFEGSPEPSTLQSEPKPTLEEARMRLPEAFADVGEPVVEEHPPSGATTSASFTTPIPRLGDGASLTGTLTLTRGLQYTPTPADLLAAKKTGTEMVGATVQTERHGDQLIVTMSGYVPETSLGTPGGFAPSASFIPPTLMWARWGFRAAFSAAQGLDTEETVRGTDGKYERLNQLLDSVNANCEGVYAAIHRDALQSLNERALATDATKAALILAGVVLAPATFGIGTLAVWGVTFLLDKQADYLLNDAFDKEAAQIAADCPRDDNNPPDWPDDRDQPDDDTIADPTWIHDPSGYVFEAVPSNRVEGVQATLTSSTTPNGPFAPWNAEWFGQTNPLVTDGQGAYGWDVPAGFWQVNYTKAGYEPAASEVLEVLPPRFDVNVGLVSRATPEVAALSARSGEAAAVDVTFSRYLQLSVVEDGLVGVTGADGSPVPGHLVSVDAEQGPTGTFVRTVRFVPDQPLAPDTTLSVTVDAAATSYAGVPLGARYTGSVTATPPPQDGPACTIVGTEGNDKLVGTKGDDVICGLGGNDTITGKGGNDVIRGGAGDDVINAGDGDDTVVGGEGNDKLNGGKGNDRLVGDAGDDTLVGADGDDQVNGGEGNDKLNGGKGNDVLDAGAGDDNVNGAAGDDQLTGGDGVDKVLGGVGDDRLDGGSGADDVNGGAGFDGWRNGDDARSRAIEYRF